MKITILGSGYVGLVTGVCLAARGHHVRCVDLRPDVVDRLNQGKPHIHERDLAPLLVQVIRDSHFSAHLPSLEALEGAHLAMVAVGTPSTNGKIDLSQVGDAARQIGEYLKKSRAFMSVALKSTVVPGTTDTFARNILEKHSGLKLGEFGLGMNPEFLREGDAVADFMRPDRIVLGHEDPSTLRILQEVYASWTCDKIAVNTRTAEMIKYANNCLLATQISAVNELADFAASVGGIDIVEVMEGVHLDKRWNPVDSEGKRVQPSILSYLTPGCGFGGSCFPKDLEALRGQGQWMGRPMHLLEAVLRINEDRPAEVVRLLEKTLGGLERKKILVLGLAFKPETDDIRESASLKIIRQLLEKGAHVEAHDPVAVFNAQKAISHADLHFVEDWESLTPHCDAIIVATRWNQYQKLASDGFQKNLHQKVILDARRMFDPRSFPQSLYLAIGRSFKT